MGEWSRVALASVSACAFAVIIASANSVNPMLPLLREEAGLDPLALSLTFALYVGAAVATLAMVARRRRPFAPEVLLPAALFVCVAANVCLAGGTQWQILAGKALTGLAVGRATGSAAALVVDSLRGRGRGLAATGNLVGAVIGTAAAQPFAAAGTMHAAATLFLVLAGAAAALSAILISCLLVRRIRSSKETLPHGTMPHRRASLGAGGGRKVAGAATAWVALAVAVVYAPTIFFDASMPVAQVIGSVAMLAASAAAQLGSGALAKVFPRMSGLLVLAFGLAAVMASVIYRADVIAVLAMVMIGIGGATAYRTSLVSLTDGADPARQSALASAFAVSTYAASAVAVLMIGAFGAWLPTEAVLSGLCAILIMLAGLFARRAPRLGAV